MSIWLLLVIYWTNLPHDYASTESLYLSYIFKFRYSRCMSVSWDNLELVVTLRALLQLRYMTLADTIFVNIIWYLMIYKYLKYYHICNNVSKKQLTILMVKVSESKDVSQTLWVENQKILVSKNTHCRYLFSSPYKYFSLFYHEWCHDKIYPIGVTWHINRSKDPTWAS